MPAAVRLGDRCTGHGNYNPRPTIEASPDCFVNGRGQHRQGDALAIHCNNSCHSGTTAGGSSTSFANGKAKARVGDRVSCGGSLAQGSPDVNIGG
jgi:uncharacterized Zn-binding protein involved in type VI secretion